MIFAGMIFQYNEQTQSGLIMLTDGTTKEFSTKEWIDEENVPAVGQKISYETIKTGVGVRVASEVDTKETSKELISVEEHTQKFIDLGYNLVKDTSSTTTRTVVLRSFATGESQEVIITQEGSEVTISERVNGKAVTS